MDRGGMRWVPSRERQRDDSVKGGFGGEQK